MSTSSVAQPVPAGRTFKAALWVAQTLLCIPYVMIGFAKLTSPIPKLAATMAWTGQAPELFVRTMGIVDLAGGIGILLPALTRIQPRLTVAAALGCTALQVLAIAFHVVRGEAATTPLNFVLLALSGFVLWGRGRKAPIQARRTRA